METLNYNRCLLLDSTYMAKNIVDSKRAFVIYFKGNAEIIKSHPEFFKLVNPETKIAKPSIIRVGDYINHYGKSNLTRENVFKRDGYACVYCPEGTIHKKSFLTLDHVIPQSKGGGFTWDNLVTACKTCNGLKADLSLEEFTKQKIPNPRRPHYLMLMKSVGYIHEEWKKYLFF